MSEIFCVSFAKTKYSVFLQSKLIGTQMKLYTLDEVKDELLGKLGTPDRIETTLSARYRMLCMPTG